MEREGKRGESGGKRWRRGKWGWGLEGRGQDKQHLHMKLLTKLQTLCSFLLTSQIAELGHSPTAGRHKIWSFTPTPSPVLGRRRTDPNSPHVLNGLTVDSLVLAQLEEEGKKEGRKRKGKNKDKEGCGKESPQQVCVVHQLISLSFCLFRYKQDHHFHVQI